MSAIRLTSTQAFYSLDPKIFLQNPESFLPHRASTPHILPIKVRNFFSQQGLSKNFHPFYPKLENLTHVQLKNITDKFESRVKNQGLSLDKQIEIAERIAQDIRNTAPCMASLFELGFRFHMTYRLLKIQSDLPETTLKSISKIYNFMTVDNTFVLPETFTRLIMRQNLIPRIASTITNQWRPKKSLDGSLAEAETIIFNLTRKFKSQINRSHLENEESIFRGKTDNADIQSLLRGLDAALRNTFAQKLVTNASLPCKVSYAKTGKLPKDITQTIKKISDFLNLSDKNIRSQLAVLCDPAKDLLSQVLDTGKSIQTHCREIKQEALEKHARVDSGFFNCIFPCLASASHTKINQVKHNKYNTIIWAEKQYHSDKPIPYLLSQDNWPEGSSLFRDFAPSKDLDYSSPYTLDLLTS